MYQKGDHSFLLFVYCLNHLAWFSIAYPHTRVVDKGETHDSGRELAQSSRSPRKQLVHGSTVRGLVRFAECPFCVVGPDRRFLEVGSNSVSVSVFIRLGSTAAVNYIVQYCELRCGTFRGLCGRIGGVGKARPDYKFSSTLCIIS